MTPSGERPRRLEAAWGLLAGFRRPGRSPLGGIYRNPRKRQIWKPAPPPAGPHLSEPPQAEDLQARAHLAPRVGEHRPGTDAPRLSVTAAPTLPGAASLRTTAGRGGGPSRTLQLRCPVGRTSSHGFSAATPRRPPWPPW